jgi:hypothetical protein
MSVMRPARHAAGPRNRRKSLHHAKVLLESLQYVDARLRRLLDEEVRYQLGRAARLVNRLQAEVNKKDEK